MMVAMMLKEYIRYIGKVPLDPNESRPDRINPVRSVA